MHSDAFTEISLIIALALAVSAVLRAFKQPLIIGYILTGVLAGPSLLDLVHSEETVELLSSFGIALLLFIVGLGLNPRVIREVGKVAIITGIGQVVITTALGFLLLVTLGFNAVPALYVSLALAFSSTIIVLKLLSDKKEQNRLYGKVSIGFLLVQDILATFALLFASGSGQEGGVSNLGPMLLKGGAIAVGLSMIGVYLLPRLSKFIAESQEFLFLFAIAWGLGVGALAAYAGFSVEVGALFAGVVLASLAYAQEMAARLRPLRDFFIVLFFIALGSRLQLESLGAVLPLALLLSAVTLVATPIIVMAIMGLLGYTRKTSFKTGVAVAQISEFSLVFILVANRAGQISDTTVSLVTLVGMMTIAASTYMIIYSDQLYTRLEPLLRYFERHQPRRELVTSAQHDMVLFGYQKGGSQFVKVFQQISNRFIVVDYNPEVIDQLEHREIPFVYGDATDPELLEEIQLSKAKMIVSGIEDHQANLFLAKFLAKENPEALAIYHSDSAKEAEDLYEAGASYVMLPHYLGSERIASFIKKSGFKKTEFKKIREKHLAYLQARLNDASAAD